MFPHLILKIISTENCEMLNKHFAIFDSIEVLDTSNNLPIPICRIATNGSFTPLADSDIPDWFKNGVPNIYAMLTPQET